MKKEGYYFISGIVLLNILVIILFSLNNPFDDPFFFFIRLFSLLGLVAMFISALLTPFQKELYQIFKKPFIKIHHFSTISGLVLITLHPVVFAINMMIKLSFVDGLRVFIPDFSSAFNFWLLAGRPALILIYVALLGALIRKALKKGWRWIHGLNYIALIFGVVHGILNGTDFYNFQTPIIPQKLVMTILFLAMVMGALCTFTIKRVKTAKKLIKRRQQLKAAAAAEESEYKEMNITQEEKPENNE